MINVTRAGTVSQFYRDISGAREDLQGLDSARPHGESAGVFNAPRSILNASS